MIINDLDDYYIVFDTKNRNIELDTLFVRRFFHFEDSKIGLNDVRWDVVILHIINQQSLFFLEVVKHPDA